MKKYILAIDQGTTSSRTVLFNDKGVNCAVSQRETKQIYPKHGWVEQDAENIYKTQLKTLREVVKTANLNPVQIGAIGITNQRETTVVWHKKTGKPIYNAIVWQDVRTSKWCQKLQKAGKEKIIKEKTGLVLDSYFSATKIKWILDTIPNARTQAKNNELLFGTIDTWLLWKMTKGKIHATDYSNASRTLLFNIHTLNWDEELLDLFDIPKSLLPQVKPSSYHFGDFKFEKINIPITGIAGDQQAALFGQACFKKGDTKNTYGTGCFLLMNTGEKAKPSKNGLLTTIAWGLNHKVYYALEGSVFIGGAAIKWLRDGLQLIKNAAESELFASKVKEESSVYVVPAFAGLGAPFWDMDARGAIFGLTQDTNKNHLIKATLESIAYRSKDLILAMESDSNIKLANLNVDGGASANGFLMQFQADILNTIVKRAKVIESTALGAAYLAGIEIGLWTQEEIISMQEDEVSFYPKMSKSKREQLYKNWLKAVKRSMHWED